VPEADHFFMQQQDALRATIVRYFATRSDSLR
jgi:alpha/beta superfamily hydrolase